MKTFALILWVVLGCARAEQTDTNPDPKVAPVPSVGIELAGVTLAEDCGDGAATRTPPPPNAGTQEASSATKAPAVAQDIAAGACAPGANCGGPMRMCNPTSMQIAIKPNGQKTSVKVKRVELLDASGKVVAELTARKPTKWDGSAYVAWDEQLAGGDVSASYLLSAPDWDKLTKGRWNAANHRFQLRVTVVVGDKERQIEKQSIQPAMPEPEVVT